jgi:hypothetical protein
MTSEPEHPRRAGTSGCRFEVEALQQVEHGQAEEQYECQSQRALSTPPEVRRGHEQQHRGGIAAAWLSLSVSNGSACRRR